MPLFAESVLGDGVRDFIAIAALAVGTGYGLYFGYRRLRRENTTEESKAKREADKADADARLEARKRDLEIQKAEIDHKVAEYERLIKSLGNDIEGLRKNEEKQREAYNLLQAGVIERLMRANDLHHECEKKQAALEERQKNTEREHEQTKRDLEQTRRELKSAERKIRRLEDRGDNGDATAPESDHR